MYCGFNVTKTNREPVDQIQAFIAAKKIQNYNKDFFGDTGIFISFIGGLFEVLNCKNLEETNEIVKINNQKEISKKKLFQKIYKRFNLKGEILITKDLWKDERYWEILKGLFDSGVFTRGQLIKDTLGFYESKDQLIAGLKVKDLPPDLINMPLEFVKKVGNYPAPILYTPAEVAEAYYLKEKYNISIKIGQAQERTYDKYLYEDLSVFRLKQPVSLSSLLKKPDTVTPYIDKPIYELSKSKKESDRLYFDDSLDKIKEKIDKRDLQEYAITTDDSFGEVINPILEKMILSVESASASGQDGVVICGAVFTSGQGLIDAVLEGKLELKDIKASLPRLINLYVIKPFRN